MDSRLTRGVFVVVAFALLAVPSTVAAHGGNNDPTVLHVCIGDVTKVVRSVGVSGSCLAGPPPVAETAHHWPLGTLAGPKGDKGDKGDNGTSVTFEGYFSGSQHGCPNGGATYAAGNPPVNTYVCNGTDGIDGDDGVNGVRPDPPCFDDANRYVDCGNGTVTDTVTGLIWLKNANCFAPKAYAAANQAAAGLADGQCGLTDGSSAGDWGLPTKLEWEATIAQAVALGCVDGALAPKGRPSLTNDPGTACLVEGPTSFTAVQLGYWSSTTDFFAGGAFAWAANPQFGVVQWIGKFGFNLPVWPVRGGR